MNRRKRMPRSTGYQRMREACAKMPPLSHWPDKRQPFDIERSEVAKWLAAQPEILKWIFATANDSGGIEYDPASNTWRGRSLSEFNRPGRPMANTVKLQEILPDFDGRVTAANVNTVAGLMGVSEVTVWRRWSEIKEQPSSSEAMNPHVQEA